MGHYYYFDTSAQVKYYVSEPGSTWVRQLVEATDPETGQPANRLFTAIITVAEAAAAFAIIARVGRISEQTRDHTFNRYMKTVSTSFHLLAVTEEVTNLAAQLAQRHPLKGYDAVQLASALRLQKVLGTERLVIFVAGDESVLVAAKAEGLNADNPFWHVAEDEGRS